MHRSWNDIRSRFVDIGLANIGFGQSQGDKRGKGIEEVGDGEKKDGDIHIAPAIVLDL